MTIKANKKVRIKVFQIEIWARKEYAGFSPDANNDRTYLCLIVSNWELKTCCTKNGKLVKI